jgi:DNA helicase HerA-like ATPase
MRPNPELDIEKVILELSVGEGLISLLDAKGSPGITQRAWVLAPGSQIGPITPEERRALIDGSVVAGAYEKEIDRESALEMLRARAESAAASAPAAKAGSGAAAAGGAATSPMGGALGGLGGLIFGTTGPRGGKRDGLVDVMAKSAARSAGTAVSRALLRGVLGSLMGGKRR